MRYLLLLMLVSCGPKFKVGDCTQEKKIESWENGKKRLIIAVGKYKYLYKISEYKYDFSIAEYDSQDELIECPAEPHEFDKLQWKEPRPR